MKKATYYLILILLFSCSGPQTENTNDSFSEVHQLDSIYGDKIIDQDTNNIRQNNFQDLNKITYKDLKLESELYSIESKYDKYYIVRQKKNYIEARQFNIVFRAKDEKIINHFIIQDFSIKDLVFHNNKVFLLCHDWDNQNELWKSEQQVKIICVDDDLNEQWIYLAKTRFPLQAERIETDNNSVSFIINVITGCHMCYNIVRLSLTEDGKFKSAEEIGTYNSSSINQEELDSLFK